MLTMRRALVTYILRRLFAHQHGVLKPKLGRRNIFGKMAAYPRPRVPPARGERGPSCVLKKRKLNAMPGLAATLWPSHSLLAPTPYCCRLRIRLAKDMSLAWMVTRLAWMAQRLVSSKRPTR